ncbi:MAG: pilus assembly protein PilM [Candidatus Omnitrophica bacterium]|nr:pilus assembly protein PilM [Candidatus Omnitrophota bacterium]
MFGIDIRKLNPISNMAQRERLVIDFSSNSLKFAYAKISPYRKEIISLKSIDITALAQDDISKIISTTFAELKTKDAEIINTISSPLVITKNIEIPSVDPREIKEIISLQAGRHTPYSREEIIVDYIDIGTYKHSYTKILLVIVARNVVKRQFAILDKAGLRLKHMSFAPEALGPSAAKILKIETIDSPVSILHIDEGFTDFTVVFRNKLVFIRSIPIGLLHLTTEKERYEIRFIEEIKRSLEAYQSENIEKTPNMLVLTGSIEGLKDLEMTLNNTLHLPTMGVSYFKNLIISEQVLRAISFTKHLSFLSVIATLLSWEEMKIDLVPEEIKLRLSLEERGKDLIKTGIFILAIFVLGFCILISKIYFKGIYLKNLNIKYQNLNQQAQVLEKDFSRISLIKNYLSNRGFSLEILSELYNLIPLDLELNDIRFDEQGKFAVRGSAGSMSTVFSFVENMEKSKYFKDVKTKYTTKRKEGTKDVTDFEIVSILRKE